MRRREPASFGASARVRLVAVAAAAAGALIVAACSSSPGTTPPPQVPGGNPQAGQQDILSFGCGACHVIPGVRGADGTVGPPLTDWMHRGYIAGELPNNGDDLVRWLVDPPSVEPGTDMPNLGLTQDQGRDVAAYLFTIGS